MPDPLNMPDPVKWYIQLLGDVRVTDIKNRTNAQLIKALNTQKTRQLFCYLALQIGKEQKREHLINLFWPYTKEDAKQRSLNSLSNALTSIRALVESNSEDRQTVILSDRESITLRRGIVRTDVQFFETCLSKAAIFDTNKDMEIGEELIKEIFACYKGPLAPGYYVDEIISEGHRLNSEFVDFVAALADRYAQQDTKRSLRYLNQARKVEPLNENLIFREVSLYLNIGETAKAKVRCLDYVRQLHRATGEKPSHHFLKLSAPLSISEAEYESVFNSTRRAKRKVQSPRPASQANKVKADHNSSDHPALQAIVEEHLITPFFGRKSEIAKIEQLLLPHLHHYEASSETGFQPRLLTLKGYPGCGKTRLAQQVLQRVLSNFDAKGWFIRLENIKDAPILLERIAHAVGIEQPSGLGAINQVAAILASHPALLILDNFDYLVESGTSVVEQLLRLCPSLYCLITSRRELNSQAERLIEIHPLPTPPLSADANLKILERSDSVQMFVSLAQAKRPTYHLADHMASTAELCRRLEGIPLTIEIVAARMVIFTTPDALLTKLDQIFSFSNKYKSIPEHHRTLWIAIDWSYGILSDPAKQCFRYISIFKDGWTLEAAEFMLGADKAAEYLQELVSSSLIQADQVNLAPRYKTLEALREFADLQLTGQERDDVQKQHTKYFRDKILSFSATVSPSEETNSWLHLEPERQNFEAVLERHHAFEDAGVLADLVFSLASFWKTLGYYSSARKWLSILIKHLDQPDQNRAKALLLAGDFARLQDDNITAINLLTESAQIFRTLETAEELASVLYQIGYSYMMSDQLDKAQIFFEESVALAKSLTYNQPWAQSLNGLGNIALNRSEFSQAHKYYDEAEALCKKSNHIGTLIQVTISKGMLSHRQNNLDVAIGFFDAALIMADRVKDKRGYAIAASNKALVLHDRCLYSAAADLWNVALEFFEQVGNQHIVAMLLTNLSSVATYRSEFASAQTLCDKSLEILRRIPIPSTLALALSNSGCIAMHMGNYVTAFERLSAALEIKRDLHDTTGVGSILSNMGILAWNQSKVEEAENLHTQSLYLFQENNHEHGIAIAQLNLGIIFTDSGLYDQAKELLTSSLTLRHQLEDLRGIAESMEGCAGLLIALGDISASCILLGQAGKIRQEIGTPILPTYQAEYNRIIDALNRFKDQNNIDGYWLTGQTQTVDEVVIYTKTLLSQLSSRQFS